MAGEDGWSAYTSVRIKNFRGRLAAGQCMRRRWPLLTQGRQTTSRRQAAESILKASLRCTPAHRATLLAMAMAIAALSPATCAGPALAWRADYWARCRRRLRLRLQGTQEGRRDSETTESDCVC